MVNLSATGTNNAEIKTVTLSIMNALPNEIVTVKQLFEQYNYLISQSDSHSDALIKY